MNIRIDHRCCLTKLYAYVYRGRLKHACMFVFNAMVPKCNEIFANLKDCEMSVMLYVAKCRQGG